MALIPIVPPLIEPVFLQDLKDFMRVDFGDTSNDGVIQALGLSARQWCETYTQAKFVTQTWRLLSDFFPGMISERMLGSKISSPFVSGANSILTGIRFGFLLPYVPCQAVEAFIYQNANGQVTSMIVGPLAIAAVGNITNNPLVITTAVPHGFTQGASVTFAGNAALAAVLNTQSQLYVNLIDASNFSINGTSGTGSTISAGGTVTGYNFVQDIVSKPARLTPIFGQFWPVARVVVNAVQIDYVCGYGGPLTVSTSAGSPILGAAVFAASDIGKTISIPGAAPWGSTLNTIILSVDGSGIGTMAAVPETTLSNVVAVYNVPESIKTAIKLLTTYWYETRVPDETNIPMAVKAILGPWRDLRV